MRLIDIKEIQYERDSNFQLITTLSSVANLKTISGVWLVIENFDIAAFTTKEKAKEEIIRRIKLIDYDEDYIKSTIEDVESWDDEDQEEFINSHICEIFLKYAEIS